MRALNRIANMLVSVSAQLMNINQTLRTIAVELNGIQAELKEQRRPGWTGGPR